MPKTALAGREEGDTADLRRLRGVSDAMVGRLANLGIFSIVDLLFHLPQRYEDRTRIVPLGALQPGTSAQVAVTVEASELVFRRRRSLLVHVSDKTGSLLLRFFHFSRAQQRGFAPQSRYLCFGEVRRGPAGLEMVHPEYRRLAGTGDPPTGDSLTPIYPTTSGIRQPTLLKLTQQALDEHLDLITEYIPREVLERHALPALGEALKTAHRPGAELSMEALASARHPALRRLAMEEMLAHHLGLLRQRRRRRHQMAPRIDPRSQLREKLIHQLPYALTGAQQRVIAEICDDLARPYPMLRLLQGDVGSGKTVVAAAAAVTVAQAGLQVAVMAPTELLAEQHFRNFSQWLPQLGLDIVWLASRHKGMARRRAVQQIGDGSARIVIGTHALFQEAIDFSNLGLIIIDEQHKFGVAQRLRLQRKGGRQNYRPHQLIMTATPIPRSLAMTFYADLDSSIIDELPPGRSPIETVALPAQRRPEVVARIEAACRAGQQAYWVCPLIDDSDTLQLQAANSAWEALSKALPALRVGLLHGRMKSDEKELVMRDFASGDLDLLVATTVIEVGVDVPNASLMIIENAERLGLAQMHQLRGRVGRGSRRSSCLLLHEPPLSETAQLRIAAMRETNDGFEIARRDLQMRGPGELLGARQKGALALRVANLMRDQALLPQVREMATDLEREHPGAIPHLIRRWTGGGELGEV